MQKEKTYISITDKVTELGGSEELAKAFDNHVKSNLRGEVFQLFEDAINEDWESITTLQEAFDHISDNAEDPESKYSQYRAQCRKVDIFLGNWVRMPDDEFYFGTPAFKLRGIKYIAK